MRVKLYRNIFFHSAETGLIAKEVVKEYDGVPPIKGAVLEDSAWHRNDEVLVDSILINTDEPDCYHVDLTPKEADSAERVKSYAEMTELHGWKPLY
mgnify:CR=1 FL=1|jgi:hypothetical protein